MVLAGNLVSLVGCLLMVAVGFIKRKDHMMGVQCIQFGFMGAGHLLLGATAGLWACVVSVVRNLVFAKVKGSIWLKLFFIAVQLLMTLYFGADSWIHWLPLAACAVFVWFLDTKNVVLFKIVIIISQVFWCVYDFHFQNYTTFAFDIMTIISNVTGIVMVKKAEQ